MPILFVSEDDGALYTEGQVDGPDGFWRLEVPNQIVLTPMDLTLGYGQTAEMLLKAGKATKVA
jgi:hypothetical protein